MTALPWILVGAFGTALLLVVGWLVWQRTVGRYTNEIRQLRQMNAGLANVANALTLKALKGKKSGSVEVAPSHVKRADSIYLRWKASEERDGGLTVEAVER